MVKISSIELVSNAPNHWPKISMEGPLGENTPEQRLANRLRFITAAEAVFRGSKIEVLEANVLRITSKGVIEVPLRLRAPEGEYDVFFYPDADSWAAGHFQAVQGLAARSFGRIRPIFYSNDDLGEVFPDEVEDVVRQDKLYLNAALFPAKGEYAMWWAENPGERFELSPAFKTYDRLYREINGLEFSILAMIMLDIGIIQNEEEFDQESISSRSIKIPLEGPEGVPLILSFSEDRGIRFHLHTQRATAAYRDSLLELILQKIKLWKKCHPSESTRDSLALMWWKNLLGRTRETMEEQVVSVIGLIRR